ncbi:Uncharacterised protein [Mycobacteroides abscessus subsp. massiliense]|nr:Uncharacterised protein [Mycobacteroides abscessus subsp. massiliense]
MWACIPDPLSPNSGLGMKVTVLPLAHAVFLMMYLNNSTSSAAASSVLNL